MCIISNKICKIINIKLVNPRIILCHKYYDRKFSVFIIYKTAHLIIIITANIFYIFFESYNIADTYIVSNFTIKIRAWKQNIFIIPVPVFWFGILVAHLKFYTIIIFYQRCFRYPYPACNLWIYMRWTFIKVHIIFIIFYIDSISRNTAVIIINCIR